MNKVGSQQFDLIRTFNDEAYDNDSWAKADGRVPAYRFEPKLTKTIGKTRIQYDGTILGTVIHSNGTELPSRAITYISDDADYVIGIAYKWISSSETLFSILKVRVPDGTRISQSDFVITNNGMVPSRFMKNGDKILIYDVNFTRSSSNKINIAKITAVYSSDNGQSWTPLYQNNNSIDTGIGVSYLYSMGIGVNEIDSFLFNDGNAYISVYLNNYNGEDYNQFTYDRCFVNLSCGSTVSYVTTINGTFSCTVGTNGSNYGGGASYVTRQLSKNKYAVLRVAYQNTNGAARYVKNANIYIFENSMATVSASSQGSSIINEAVGSLHLHYDKKTQKYYLVSHYQNNLKLCEISLVDTPVFSSPISIGLGNMGIASANIKSVFIDTDFDDCIYITDNSVYKGMKIYRSTDNVISGVTGSVITISGFKNAGYDCTQISTDGLPFAINGLDYFRMSNGSLTAVNGALPSIDVSEAYSTFIKMK